MSDNGRLLLFGVIVVTGALLAMQRIIPGESWVALTLGLLLPSPLDRNGKEPRGGAGGYSPSTAAMPVSGVALLFILGMTACSGDTEFTALHWSRSSHASAAPSYGANALLLADGLEMKPQASAPTVTSGRAAMYSLSSDGLIYTKDGNGLALKLHAAQSYRTSANCAGLSSPANGDVCYDTTIPAFRFYSAGWTTAASDDSLLVHKAGSETITGVKTLSAAPVFAAGLTASGSSSNDFSGGTGPFKTSTGAVTIGPGAVGVSGDVTLTTTKTLAAGANTLISGDKLQAAQLAIASQATGDLLYASSGTAWARLAAGTSGYPLLSGGAGMAPAWAQIGATGISTGTLVYATVTGGAKGALGAATGYLVGPGVAWTTSTEHVLYVATRAATVRSLYCNLGTAPGGSDTVDVTVRKGGSDQTTTCQIAASATTCNDVSHTFSVAAGNVVSVKGVSSAGTAADLTCSLEVGN